MEKAIIAAVLILGLIFLASCPKPPSLDADFVALTTEEKAGEKITFTDKTKGGTPPYSYEWDFDNDGKVDSTEASPTYTYAEPGTYTVSLKVTDAEGKTDTKVKEAYITIIAEVELLGKHFVELLNAHKFDEAQEMLAEIMVEGLKEQGLTLESIWSARIAQVGELKKIEKTRLTEEMGYRCVYVTCRFERASLDVKVVFDEKDKVAGLWFLPPK